MLKDLIRTERMSDDELRTKIGEERDHLFSLQMKIKDAKLPVMVIFEGWTAAGKGGSGRSSRISTRDFLRLQRWTGSLAKKKRDTHSSIGL